MAVPEAVEQVARLSERTVQLSVLLGDLADLADQPAEPELADLLEQLAGAVHTTAERFGTEEGPAQAVADAAARVQRGRDPKIEPAQVRATCRVTIADALADIAPRGG
jgi:ABC-type transporter Mla subunit MlaD